MLASLQRLLPNIQQDAQSRLRKKQKQLAEKLVTGVGKSTTDIQIFEIVAKFIKDTNRFS